MLSCRFAEGAEGFAVPRGAAPATMLTVSIDAAAAFREGGAGSELPDPTSPPSIRRSNAPSVVGFGLPSGVVACR
ncbi:MAG: hypothetical protein AAFN05_02700 [Pseudomonadota bacterium]